MLAKTIKKHVDQYYEAIQAAKALAKRFFRKTQLLTPRASFDQTHSMNAITDQRGVDGLGTTSLATSVCEDLQWLQSLPCVRGTDSYEFPKLK